MAISNRELVTIFRTGVVDPQSNPELARSLLESRTKVASSTGFMMRFGDLSHQSLTVFDVLALPGQSYPVSDDAYDSLPAYIQADLERQGAIQILAHYDPEAGTFSEVSLAEEPTADELIAHVASLLGQGLSLHEAIDHIAIRELEQYTPTQWAAIRGVSDEAIKNTLRKAQRKLDEDNSADSP